MAFHWPFAKSPWQQKMFDNSIVFTRIGISPNNFHFFVWVYCRIFFAYMYIYLSTHIFRCVYVYVWVYVQTYNFFFVYVLSFNNIIGCLWLNFSIDDAIQIVIAKTWCDVSFLLFGREVTGLWNAVVDVVVVVVVVVFKPESLFTP